MATVQYRTSADSQSLSGEPWVTIYPPYNFESLGYVQVRTIPDAEGEFIACDGNVLFARVNDNRTYAAGSEGGVSGTGVNFGTQVLLNPGALVVGSEVEFVDISVKYNHAIGLDSSGRIYFWGTSTYGEHGTEYSWIPGQVVDPFTTTVPVPGPTQGYNGSEFVPITWAKVVIGKNSVCGIDTNGKLWGWGLDSFGSTGVNVDQGQPGYDIWPYPRAIDTVKTDWVEVAMGEDTAGAIDSNGDIYMWGRNFYGLLAQGLTEAQLTHSSVPLKYANTEGYVYRDLEIRDNYASVVSDMSIYFDPLYLDNTLDSIYVWGQYLDDVFGNVIPQGQDCFVPTFASCNPYTTTSHGEHHTLMLNYCGRIFATGRNYHGCLGIGNPYSTYSTRTLVEVKFTNDDTYSHLNTLRFVAVKAGDNISMAIDTQGRVWVWGGIHDGYYGDVIAPVQWKIGNFMESSSSSCSSSCSYSVSAAATIEDGIAFRMDTGEYPWILQNTVTNSPGNAFMATGVNREMYRAKLVPDVHGPGLATWYWKSLISDDSGNYLNVYTNDDDYFYMYPYDGINSDTDWTYYELEITGNEKVIISLDGDYVYKFPTDVGYVDDFTFTPYSSSSSSRSSSSSSSSSAVYSSSSSCRSSSSSCKSSSSSSSRGSSSSSCRSSSSSCRSSSSSSSSSVPAFTTVTFKGRTYEIVGNVVEQSTWVHTGPTALAFNMITGTYTSAQFTVTGPGILEFWWSVNTRVSGQEFLYKFDGNTMLENYGQWWGGGPMPWSKRIIDDIPAGTHKITFYISASSQYYGYLDDVTFTPT